MTQVDQHPAQRDIPRCERQAPSSRVRNCVNSTQPIIEAGRTCVCRRSAAHCALGLPCEPPHAILEIPKLPWKLINGTYICTMYQGMHSRTKQALNERQEFRILLVPEKVVICIGVSIHCSSICFLSRPSVERKGAIGVE